MDPGSQRALDALELAVLENGQRWGQTAVPYQRANAVAILDVDSPVKQSWIELPRGARKTTDLAGLLLTVLLFQAPPMARLYVGASDEEQAAELIDAAEGLIARTPEFRGLFRVSGLEIEVAATGAAVRALAGDLSAMGKRAYLIVLDEVANWPQTKRAKKFWTVLTSGNRKIPECRTVVISNCGEPGSWQWKRREVARSSPHWRFYSQPGPLPWLTETDLAMLRENAVTESEFTRLHLNKWVASEDRLASREDLAACTVLPGPLPPVRGRSYVVTVDIGVVHDRTVVTVMHREDDGHGRRVVLDRIVRWQGSRADPVPLAAVARTMAELSREYSGAEIVLDPYQAKLISQELSDRGARVHEFAFTSTSVGRLALSLHQAIRQHRLVLPADEELLDELGTVRLIKNTMGTYRLDHDNNAHDDQAVALALGCYWLLDQESGPRFHWPTPIPAVTVIDPQATGPARPLWGEATAVRGGLVALNTDGSVPGWQNVEWSS